MSLQVYIPTRGRVGWNKQLTLRKFLDLSSHKPILVCPPDEVRSHRDYYVRVVGCPGINIGQTRQHILETSGSDIVVMADDDMTFAYRPNPELPKLKVCPSLDPMLRLIRDCVDKGYVHGGIGPRQGNGLLKKQTIYDTQGCYQDVGRVNNFHYFDRVRFLSTGVKFDDWEVMEDFYVTLRLLQLGLPNRIIQNYVWDQGTSGASGGCSIYRTLDRHNAAAAKLAEHFPNIVRLVTKTSTSAWFDGKPRNDVVVQWKKAYAGSGS